MAFHFKFPLSKKSPPLIGLDISTSSVKLVELAEAGRGTLRLEHCAIEPLPRGAVTDGNIENIDHVAEAVRRAWKKSGTHAKYVVLAMPPASVITKKIVLPGGLTEEELEVQVESEASQYIPFALEEVSLDFDVIGPAPHAPEDVEVLLAATRREKVEDRVAVAEAAGLTPTIVDIESYAAHAVINRLLSASSSEKNHIIALFQIGSQVTHISMLLDGHTIYEREQPFGGNQLTQDIARAYGFSPEEAEARKKAHDLPQDFEKNILKPFLENAALEVTRSLQFFFTSTPHTRIDQILLAGGCATLPGLVDMVADRTDVSTSIINPFKDMAMAVRVRERQLRSEAPSYLIACGLAMRRFDS